jgi:hypothetical protein
MQLPTLRPKDVILAPKTNLQIHISHKRKEHALRTWQEDASGKKMMRPKVLLQLSHLIQRRTDLWQYRAAPYLKSGDDDGAKGRPGRVEEERLWLEDGRPGRRRLTPGRTAGEGSGEWEDGDGRRLRGDGQQRDARVGFRMDCRIGEGEWRWRDRLGRGNRQEDAVEALTKF